MTSGWQNAPHIRCRTHYWKDAIDVFQEYGRKDFLKICNQCFWGVWIELWNSEVPIARILTFTSSYLAIRGILFDSSYFEVCVTVALLVKVSSGHPRVQSSILRQTNIFFSVPNIFRHFLPFKLAWKFHSNLVLTLSMWNSITTFVLLEPQKSTTPFRNSHDLRMTECPSNPLSDALLKRRHQYFRGVWIKL